MSLMLIFSLICGLLVASTIGGIIFKKVPRKLKPEYFNTKWVELQGLCRDKSTWSDALIAADRLLDTALRKRRYKGKTMGARLMQAQRMFTDNDDIWDAHNLVKKLVAEPDKVKLKQNDTKEALISFREALKDLGAIPRGDENK